MFKDSIIVTGKLQLNLFDSNNVLQSTTDIDNLVVTVGKIHIAALLSSSPPPTAMGWIAVGTGTTTQTIGDTLLQSEIGTRVAVTKPSSGQVVTYSATFSPGNATGAWAEAGIFNSATINAGTMLAHTTFPVVNKASGDTIVVTWSVTIS
jgi:hypothetical protein